jgi:hypothetical protein
METQEKKLKLAKKYFWEQKKEEISSFFTTVFYIALFIIAVAFFFLGVVGVAILIIDLLNLEVSTAGTWCLNHKNIFYSITVLGIIFGILCWLNSNWQRAKKRAGL